MARYIEFFLLGLFQGVFEWLPVSSQGGLVLLLVLVLGFKASEALDISIFLHLGSCLAALVYFRRDVANILKRGSEEDERMLFFLIIASIATVLSGLPTYLLLREAVSQGEAFLGPVGLALIITGLAQRKGGYRRRIASGTASMSTGIFVGLLQGLSALPGLSRSGITIFALLLKGYTAREALRISYLLSIPASLFASFGLVLLEGSLPLGSYLQIAILASFISGILTIGLLMRVSQKINFSYFCIFMGLIAFTSFIIKYTIILT